MPNKSKISKPVGARPFLVLFLVPALMVLVVSVFERNTMHRNVALLVETTQHYLLAAAEDAARLLTVEELDRYHTIEDTQTPEYQEIKNRLAAFAEEYNVLFVYFWRSYGEGLGQFIVDNDADLDKMVGPWEIFETEDIAIKALSGAPSVTNLDSYTSTWTGLITASAPVLDSAGNVYCIAGVDINDEVFFIQHRNARNLLITQAIALSIALVFGVLCMHLYKGEAQQNDEAREKLQYFNDTLHKKFSTYLSTDVVNEIIADPTNLRLDGTRRRMTVLFTDLKDFSRIAESLSPENLVKLLNLYLSAMSDVILKQKGTIDKFKGDAIAAFFGAPIAMTDHALRACNAALIIKRLENEMNKKPGTKQLFTRIGINTGEMVVGNMGSERKLNYTVVGRSVNLAAWLEDINKLYGSWILVTEATLKETQGKFFARKLDRVRLAGISKPMRIYELLEFSDEVPNAMREWVALFHVGLKRYEARKWLEAAKLFKSVLTLNPNDSAARLFLARSARYMKIPPSAKWDGIFTLDQK